MHALILLDFSWTELLQPQFYIDNGGLWLLLFIVFAETGLFAGFFLPGDSLLFVAGIYSSDLVGSLYNTGYDFPNLMFLVILTTTAGVLGNATGYWFGRRIGPAMYHWKDSLFFKHKYLIQAHEFYEKHGGGAIVFARFIPFVRTFAPIVAGIVQMDRKKFSFFNLVGCIAWTSTMLFSGHYLQKFFEYQFNFDLKKHLELIVLGIVIVTTAPVLIKVFTGRDRKQKKTSSDNR